MRSYIIKGLLAALTLLVFASCSDWTQAEPYDLNPTKPDDEYYRNLRAWKDTFRDREISFGWFSGWTGVGTSLKNSFIGVPDSLDIIALWGAWTMTDECIKDLREVQVKKGTKVIPTIITGWVGTGILDCNYSDHDVKYEAYGWDPDWNTSSTWRSYDPEIRPLQEEAIRRYARDVVAMVVDNGFDGIDIDWEPTVGGAGCKQELSNYDNFMVFTEEVGKYFGPMSGSSYLFVIDGEVNNIDHRFIPYFDYFVDQAYGSSSNSTLNSGKLSTMLGILNDDQMTPQALANRYVITVNYESYAYSGGGSFTGADCRMEGFAAWKPNIGGVQFERKGGCGGFH
ncbi:MAG: glycoside hydrolase family 18, partial [Alistipes sp.]|nr:glycoside hydrolase family 18 [Alistipes sp.]